MATIHIPNDSAEVTRAAFESSQPGDEVIFDAGTYTLNFTIEVNGDRAITVIDQTLIRAEGFDGLMVSASGTTGRYKSDIIRNTFYPLGIGPTIEYCTDDGIFLIE